MPDYISNIFLLMSLVSEPSTTEKFKADYNKMSIRYGDMKKQLAEDMVKFITPIREKAESIYNDKTYLQQVIEEGGENARASAEATIKEARELSGLNYFSTRRSN
jgi:tryptophanyl-tRNA synthetase